MKFTRAELEASHGQTLPDLLGPHTRLLFVGINPGLRAVAVQAHFGGGSNRFYPALFRAGILDRRITASSGLAAGDLAHLLARGVGITNLVSTASARADELSHAELVAGAAALEERVRMIDPNVVARALHRGFTRRRTVRRRPQRASPSTTRRPPDSRYGVGMPPFTCSVSPAT